MSETLSCLDEAYIEKELLALPGWELKSSQLYRLYQFKTFQQSIDFVNRLAGLAESENHHPDIEILFNMVAVKYWTHTINGISEKDLDSVRKLNLLSV